MPVRQKSSPRRKSPSKSPKKRKSPSKRSSKTLTSKKRVVKVRVPKGIKQYSYKYLDRNNDGYISIDEYLAKHRSLGPKATPGKIAYDYQDWGNFMRFFLKMMKQEKKLKLVCLPPVVVAMKRFPQYSYRAAMMIYLKEKTTVLPPTLIKAIKKCQKKGMRYVAISLMVFPHEYTGVGHQNIIVIDLVAKTIERFDPYGYKVAFRKDEHKIIADIIEDEMIEPLEKITKNDYTYIPPQHISPFRGPQERGDAFCGMCITFAMMYLHLRILNPDLSQKTVVKMMMKGGKKGIQDRVLRYARYIEDVLKGR